MLRSVVPTINLIRVGRERRFMEAQVVTRVEA